MHCTKTIGMLVSLSIGVLLRGSGLFGEFAEPQTAAPQAQGSANQGAATDEFQRSVEVYNYKMAAKSGPERGEVLYAYKCSMCHNKYTKSAPYLSDLYKRPRLISGEPVNDKTVAEKIRNGGPKMPAYRHNLSDMDMADLLSYFREGKCCYEGEDPPLNPRYRAR